MFFKILLISNTGISIAYILATVHFVCLKLGSFSDMEYYFYQLTYRDSKVPNRFVGLSQMQCSPSFDWNWGKQNKMTPLHVGTSYTHDFGFYSKGNATATHQRAWAGSLKFSHFVICFSVIIQYNYFSCISKVFQIVLRLNSQCVFRFFQIISSSSVHIYIYNI